MVLHLATILAITIGFNYFIKLDLIYLLIPFVVGFLGGIPLSLIGLIVDLKRPLLDWTNPQRAVKQNLNVLIGMVANLIFIAALVGLNYLFLKIDLNFTLIIIVDIGLISLSSIVLYKYSIKYIAERLPSIN
jgi:ABC-2 type transport system permease protein